MEVFNDSDRPLRLLHDLYIQARTKLNREALTRMANDFTKHLELDLDDGCDEIGTHSTPGENGRAVETPYGAVSGSETKEGPTGIFLPTETGLSPSSTADVEGTCNLQHDDANPTGPIFDIHEILGRTKEQT